jgi:hypothetical protein
VHVACVWTVVAPYTFVLRTSTMGTVAMLFMARALRVLGYATRGLRSGLAELFQRPNCGPFVLRIFNQSPARPRTLGS